MRRRKERRGRRGGGRGKERGGEKGEGEKRRERDDKERKGGTPINRRIPGTSCITQVYTENTSSRMCASTKEKHAMNTACMRMLYTCMRMLHTCSVYKYQANEVD